MMVMGLWNYWVVIVLMMIGLYTVIARDNLVKKMMGLNMFQVAVIMFYVSMGKVEGGTAPILIATEHADAAEHGAEARHAPDDGHGHDDGHDEAEASAEVLYSNPIPHVLMLTAIIVGVAVTSLALALVVRIQEAYGTIEEDEILEMEGSD